MTCKFNPKNTFCQHKGRGLIATGTAFTLLLTGWARRRSKGKNNRM